MEALGNGPVRIAEDNQIIGWVASGGYGYSVGKSIIYAYLPVEYSQVGTQLEVEIFAERIGAVVEPEPLWDSGGVRIKA